MAEGGKGIALASVAAGVLLAYSGLTGKSVLSTVQATVKGQAPSTAAAANTIAQPASDANTAPATGPVSPGGTGMALAGGSQIASTALQYEGEGYEWAGVPATGLGHWDCSSFVNWVCGHDLGLAIPGYAAGTYTGSSHGPPTGEWLLWGGLTTVGNSAAAAQPGDLCIWQTHMGIATSGGGMISALNPTLGTAVTTIEGGAPAGELLYVRRYA